DEKQEQTEQDRDDQAEELERQGVRMGVGGGAEPAEVRASPKADLSVLESSGALRSRERLRLECGDAPRNPRPPARLLSVRAAGPLGAAWFERRRLRREVGVGYGVVAARGRLERHPSVSGEEHLDPRMRVLGP